MYARASFVSVVECNCLLSGGQNVWFKLSLVLILNNSVTVLYNLRRVKKKILNPTVFLLLCYAVTLTIYTNILNWGVIFVCLFIPGNLRNSWTVFDGTLVGKIFLYNNIFPLYNLDSFLCLNFYTCNALRNYQERYIFFKKTMAEKIFVYLLLRTNKSC